MLVPRCEVTLAVGVRTYLTRPFDIRLEGEYLVWLVE